MVGLNIETNSTTSPNEALTVADVSKILKRTKPTVIKYIKSGLLKTRNASGPKTPYRISLGDLSRFQTDMKLEIDTGKKFVNKLLDDLFPKS